MQPPPPSALLGPGRLDSGSYASLAWRRRAENLPRAIKRCDAADSQKRQDAREPNAQVCDGERERAVATSDGRPRPIIMGVMRGKF